MEAYVERNIHIYLHLYIPLSIDRTEQSSPNNPNMRVCIYMCIVCIYRYIPVLL